MELFSEGIQRGDRNTKIRIILTAVSYTHLDVYKRQVIYSPLLITWVISGQDFVYKNGELCNNYLTLKLLICKLFKISIQIMCAKYTI